MRNVKQKTVLLGLAVLLVASCRARGAPDAPTPNPPTDTEVFDRATFQELSPPDTVTPAACNTGGGASPGPQQHTVGRAGGTISRGRVRVRILPLAVSAIDTFRVDNVTGVDVGISVTVSPGGSFSPQAVLTINSAGCDPAKQYFIAKRQQDGSWKPVSRQWRTHAHLVSAFAESFSEYALVEP